jgi:hypothetical protein
MSSWDLGSTQRWSVGRFYLNLPEAATLNRQSQKVDGIDLELQPRSHDVSLSALQAQRRKEILQDPYSPIIKEYQWTQDIVGILYVGDTSDPTYLILEGRRLLRQNVFFARTGGDRAKTDLMEKIITEALGNFQPGQATNGSTPGFGLSGGRLHQGFRHSEEVHASFHLPQPGALLQIDTEVIATPGKVDLVERAKEAAALGALDKLSIEFLRQGSKKVAGIEGVESIMALTEKGKTDFDARFEAGGRPLSPLQPELHLHLTTGPETGYRSGSMTKEQFLSFWDELLSRISSHP